MSKAKFRVNFTRFRLVGRANVFQVTDAFSASSMDCVVGETYIKGKLHRTVARVQDVEPLR